MPRLLLALLVLAPALFASVVIDDDFADGNPSGTPAYPLFWATQTAGQGDDGIFENNGNLTLLAATRPYSFACLNSRLDPRFDFFRHTVSITIEDLNLEHRNLPAKEAMFRLCLNSTEKRQTVSPRSLSLRISPGVVFFGYKTAPVGKMDAENIVGDRKGSLVHELYDGRVASLNLTVGPALPAGGVAYSLTLYTDGARGIITRQGVIPLAPGQWNDDNRSALILEARRNIIESVPDSYVSASLGRILVSSTPRP